jgi:hypothetical protein
MQIKSVSYSLLIISLFALAGCGQSGSDSEGSQGVHIAFICGQADQLQNQYLCSVQPNGLGYKKLLEVEFRERPAINSTGQIAFRCADDEICIIEADKTNFKILTDDEATKSLPSINDHGQIAFVCNATRSTDRNGDEICVINADGSGLLQLTRNSTQDTFPSINNQGDIAFQCQIRICMIDTQGQNLREVSDSVMNDFEPVLNNQGKIAFKCRAANSSPSICSIDPDINTRNIIEHESLRSTFDLNDNGIIVADCIFENSSNEICAFEFEGSLLKRLTNNETVDTAPSINDDGMISFDCGGEGFSLRLCVIKLDGSGFNEFDVESVRTNYANISD